MSVNADALEHRPPVVGKTNIVQSFNAHPTQVLHVTDTEAAAWATFTESGETGPGSDTPASAASPPGNKGCGR